MSRPHSLYDVDVVTVLQLLVSRSETHFFFLAVLSFHSLRRHYARATVAGSIKLQAAILGSVDYGSSDRERERESVCVQK
jgi:hypothetical protein